MLLKRQQKLARSSRAAGAGAAGAGAARSSLEFADAALKLAIASFELTTRLEMRLLVVRLLLTRGFELRLHTRCVVDALLQTYRVS
jgi:hypothetical protein